MKSLYAFGHSSKLNVPVDWELTFYHLKHIFSLLGTRIIPFYLFSHDPMKALQWQFNCCLQTSIILRRCVENLFYKPGRNNSNPFYVNDFVFNIYEGMFYDDPLPNKDYNHAFIFGYSKILDIAFYLDTARIGSSNMIAILPTPYTVQSYHNMDSVVIDFISLNKLPFGVSYNIKSVTKIDYPACYNQPEFFTMKKLSEIEKDIDKFCDSYGIYFKYFDWTFKLKPQATP